MNLIPSNIGAEPKKLAWLGAVLVIGGILYWINREPSAPEAHTSPLSIGAVAPIARTAASPSPRAPARNGARPMEDFKPSLKPKEGVDISKIDPTLKLDLLAKLNSVTLEPGTRGSVFDFGKAPPPPPPPAVNPVLAGVDPDRGQSAETGAAPGRRPRRPLSTTSPPIPLKFYGFSARTGAKRAFFINGDDIEVAAENEVIKNRYKVIKIGVNSVVVEDLNFKHQQTLPLVEELAG